MINKKYHFAVIATDIVIFTVREQELQVLLIQMKKKPFSGYWAAPGGLVRSEESVDAAARRILKDKSGVLDVYLEQLYTFGQVDRDPFGRVVSVAYAALIPSEGIRLKTTEEHGSVRWFPVRDLSKLKLAYDHREILHTAIERLRGKLAYTNIVYGLMPKEFTLTELQRTYEIILERKLDKRNFRKKILSAGIIKVTQKMQSGVPFRPAQLYTFVSRKPALVSVL